MVGSNNPYHLQINMGRFLSNSRHSRVISTSQTRFKLQIMVNKAIMAVPAVEDPTSSHRVALEVEGRR